MIYRGQEVFAPNDLQHFGIKGMRWGVRNKRSSGNGQGSGWKQKAKTAAKIGAAVAGTAAVGYGAYRFGKSARGQAAIGAAKNAYNEFRGRRTDGGVGPLTNPSKAWQAGAKLRTGKRLAGERLTRYGNAAKGYANKAGTAARTYGGRAAERMNKTRVGGRILSDGYVYGNRARAAGNKLAGQAAYGAGKAYGKALGYSSRAKSAAGRMAKSARAMGSKAYGMSAKQAVGAVRSYAADKRMNRYYKKLGML